MRCNALLSVVVMVCAARCFGQAATDPNKVSVSSCRDADTPAVFFENFNTNAMNWIYYSPAGKTRPMPIWDGVVYCYSPWWVDYNHAPPGAGYLHILMGLHTNETSIWTNKALPHDFTNARVTVRIRGDIDLRGAQMLWHCQANNGKTTANYVLSGQPFKITKDWSEQTVTLTPDPNQWICLGSRHDRANYYGCYEIADVLRNMNVDFIFVLFPLAIEPVENIPDKHAVQAGYKYHVKQELLPSGIIMFDWVKIECAPNAALADPLNRGK